MSTSIDIVVANGNVSSGMEARSSESADHLVGFQAVLHCAEQNATARDIEAKKFIAF